MSETTSVSDRSTKGVEQRIRVDLKLRRSSFRLLAQVELPFEGVTAVFGPSGSGKTTFLRAIAGLEREVTGSLWVGETCLMDEARGIRLAPEERGIGTVFQEGALFPHLSVLGNLEYAWDRAPEARRRGSVEELVALMGIQALLTRGTRGLSGGERQRVALARALLSCPRLLLMDEPLASLDEEAKQDLLLSLARLSRETRVPILYVTHSTVEVARLADRVLLFEQGEARLAPSVADTLARVELYSEGAQEILSRLVVRASGYDEEYQIASYAFGEETIRIPSKRAPREGTTRLIVRARDLSLSLKVPEDCSVLNALPIEITAFQRVPPAMVLVHCRASGGEMVASITRLAFEKLGLKVGTRCVAQLKATALYEGQEE